jgi:ATP-binding cassette subfamily F protein 3
VNGNEKKIKSLNQELKKVEEIIQQLEVERKQIEEEMAKPEVYSNFDKLALVQQKFDSLNVLLKEQNLKWENIVLEMDELESAN